MIALVVASIVSTASVAVLDHLQKPEPVLDVPFPPILPGGVVPTPAQVLVDTVQVDVQRQEKRDVFNAIIADIDAHCGTVIEWSDRNRTVKAFVPASYLDRIALLRAPSYAWLSPNYREWVVSASDQGSPVRATGRLTKVRIEVDGYYSTSSAMANAMGFSAMALVGSAAALIAVGIAGGSAVEQRGRRRPVTMEVLN